MRLLLDTHVLYWLARDPDRVSGAIREAIEDTTERYLSPVSAMEMTLKARRGRMPGADALVASWARIRQDLRALDTGLTMEYFARAGSLDWEHRDPFDRILVAQAQIDGLTLVTKDRAIASYPGVATLTW